MLPNVLIAALDDIETWSNPHEADRAYTLDRTTNLLRDNADTLKNKIINAYLHRKIYDQKSHLVIIDGIYFALEPLGKNGVALNIKVFGTKEELECPEISFQPPEKQCLRGA